MSIYELFNPFFSRPLLVLCNLFVARLFSYAPFLSLSFFLLFFRFHTFFPSPTSALPYVRLHSCNCLHVHDLYEFRSRLSFVSIWSSRNSGQRGYCGRFYCSPNNLKYTRTRTVSSIYLVHSISIIFFFVVKNSCSLSFTQRDWFIKRRRDRWLSFFFLSLTFYCLNVKISISFDST